MELVSVVISIFNPNIEYLTKQIESIENQDYQHIEIIIWDDNPETNVDERLFERLINKYSYQYIKCKVNLGYAKAFEKLTMLAKGKYIAYCDQDDIWMKNKISRMVAEIKKENAVLVTADRAIIDENDKIIVSSCRKKMPQNSNTWNTGDNIVVNAVFSTYAIGMNILIRADVAKQLMPIPEDTAHDKWLTAGASVKGKVAFIDEVLVQYRRHGKNASGMFRSIEGKEEYYKERVLYSYRLAEIFLERFPETDEKAKTAIMKFAKARKERKVLQIVKYRKIAPDIAGFEIILKFMPNALFKLLIATLNGRY